MTRADMPGPQGAIALLRPATLAVKNMGGETTQAWRTVLDDFVKRDHVGTATSTGGVYVSLLILLLHLAGLAFECNERRGG